MDIDRKRFYDKRHIAIIPMGYCYPGRGRSGDLPPRRECASLWLDQQLEHLPRLQLTLLIGQYAQRHYLGSRRKPTLTKTVRAWREYQPTFLPLPHPSGRNNAWMSRNPWFELEVLPALRRRCRKLEVV
jgi:uracil-DNA glycosylase